MCCAGCGIGAAEAGATTSGGTAAALQDAVSRIAAGEEAQAAAVAQLAALQERLDAVQAQV
jgi:hypothetical protein